jgi:hypothetical protein
MHVYVHFIYTKHISFHAHIYILPCASDLFVQNTHLAKKQTYGKLFRKGVLKERTTYL